MKRRNVLRVLAAAMTAVMLLEPVSVLAAVGETVSSAEGIETAAETMDESVEDVITEIVDGMKETEEEAESETAAEDAEDEAAAETVIESSVETAPQETAAEETPAAKAPAAAKAQTLALADETELPVVEVDASLKAKLQRVQIASLFGDSTLSVDTYGFSRIDSAEIKEISVLGEDITAGQYLGYKKVKKNIFDKGTWTEGIPFTVRLYRNSIVTLEVLNGVQPQGATVMVNGETVNLILVGAAVKMYENESYTFRPNPIKGYKAVLKVDGKEVEYPYTITNPTRVYAISVGYKEADLAATEMTLKEGVSVVYGTSDEEILNQVFGQVVVAEDAEVAEDAPEFSVFAEDCILTYPKGGLEIGENEVTVTYPGDGEYYDACSATVVITVTKAKATVKVGNVTVKYGEKAAVPVTTNPAGLDYITVIGGMDAFVSGFVSIDVPESTKNAMRIKDPITGAVLFDAYGKLCELIGDGASLDEFVSIIGQINDMVKGNPITDAAAGIAGFDISTLQQIVDVITKLPSMDVKITLGNVPKNAGLYLTAAVVVDGHYETAVGFGSYVVLRKSVITSSNISLGFINELPGKSLTPAEAAEFDFTACVFDDGEIVVPEKGLSVTYTGITSKGRIYSSKNVPTEAGSYVQTVALTAGNYRAFPKTRSFRITK